MSRKSILAIWAAKETYQRMGILLSSAKMCTYVRNSKRIGLPLENDIFDG